MKVFGETMPENRKRKELAVYLQDHYAGSVAAIEMLQHLIKAQGGKPLERFFSKLHSDKIRSQAQLRNIMTSLGFQKSTVRGWRRNLRGRSSDFPTAKPLACVFGIARNSAARD